MQLADRHQRGVRLWTERLRDGVHAGVARASPGGSSWRSSGEGSGGAGGRSPRRSPSRSTGRFGRVRPRRLGVDPRPPRPKLLLRQCRWCCGRLTLEAALLALRVRGRLLRVLLRLLGRTGLVAVRNSALVGGARDGECRGNAETGRERSQLAGPQLHVQITSVGFFGSTNQQSDGGAERVTAGAEALGAQSLDELDQCPLDLVPGLAGLIGMGDHERRLGEGGDEEMCHGFDCDRPQDAGVDRALEGGPASARDRGGCRSRATLPSRGRRARR